MNKVLQATEFAITAHAGQTRKGKDTPYVIHPMSVALVLAQFGAAEDVVVAGLLHDVIEDTDITYSDIEKEFGQNVAELVNAVTEKDKSLPWRERKMRALDDMDEMSRDALLLKSADVLCNMNDLLTDYKEKGDKMFENFNANGQDQLTRYGKVIEKIEKHHPQNPLLHQLHEIYKKLKNLL